MLDTLRISEKDLPGVNTWKKGGVYEVSMKVVMTAELESDSSGNRTAPVAILKYECDEMEDSEDDKDTQEPGSMLKSSIYGKPIRVENTVSPSVG